MDVKKLLYRYKQFGEAQRTAEITLSTLKERHSRQDRDENWWIRSNLPKNIIESGYITEEDIQGKIKYLEWVIAELTRIRDAIERAAKTINDDQRELIELRYFEGRTVTYICDKLKIGDNKYHYLHRTALEGMQTVLNPLCIDDVTLTALLFSPYGERLKESKRKVK